MTNNNITEFGLELARRIRLAVEATRGPGEFAAALNKVSPYQITPNGVQQWMSTGRVHKRHIPYLAQVTGQSQEYFLGEDGGPVTKPLTRDARALAEQFDALTPEGRARWIAGFVGVAPPVTPMRPVMAQLVQRLANLTDDDLMTVSRLVTALLPLPAEIIQARAPSKEYVRMLEAKAG